LRTDLYLFTTHFPTGLSGELWLYNEILITHKNYERIFIFPDHDVYDPVSLPSNCFSQQNVLANSEKEVLTVGDLSRIIKIVLSDFVSLAKHGAFASNLKYNLSLIKKLYKKAKYISKQIESPERSVLYAYWSDNAATLACMIKTFKPSVKAISRAHGYEIYEDLKKDKIIPFRNYQNKHIDCIFSVSKKGLEHLKSKYPNFTNKYSYSYLGTNDNEIAPLSSSNKFSIVTCCNLNIIKRIDLVPSILKHIKFELTWHLIGDGPEFKKIEKLNSELPSNIKVVYHKHLSQDKVFDFYKENEVNAILSVSYSEGLPVSMMEALSFGIPIITTEVGGCSEICTSNTGILLERDFNSYHVAEKIIEFKSSYMNKEQFRIGCREFWMKNFSAENNYSKFAAEISV